VTAATASAPPSATATATVSATSGAATPGVAVVSNDVIEVSSPFAFEPGSSRLKIESSVAIQEVAALLQQRPEITLVRVEVHTDSDGDEKANLKLSDERALTIARAIASKGVVCKRLTAVGFGEGKPLVPNDSPQNKVKNRRVTLAVAQLRGKSVGGKPVDGGGHVAGDPCR